MRAQGNEGPGEAVVCARQLPARDLGLLLVFIRFCFYGGLHAWRVFLLSQRESKLNECILKTEVLHKKMTMLLVITVACAWKAQAGGSWIWDQLRLIYSETHLKSERHGEGRADLYLSVWCLPQGCEGWRSDLNTKQKQEPACFQHSWWKDQDSALENNLI